MRQRQLFVTFTALLLSMVLYICTISLFQQPAIQAHSYVIGSDPVDGSTINEVPSRIRIFYDAAISPLSSAHVYFIQNGQLVDIGAAASAVSASNSSELVIPVKAAYAQQQGSYEVNWVAVANGDGHTTYGIIGFDVGFSSTGASGVSTLGPSSSNDLDGIRSFSFTNVLSIVWDWLLLAAATFWAGLLAVELLLQMDKERYADLLARTRKQTRSLHWLCLSTLLGGEIVALVLRVTRLNQALKGSSFSLTQIVRMALETNYGHFWLARIGLIILAMGVLYWTGRVKGSSSGHYKATSEVFQQRVTQEGQKKLETSTKDVVKTSAEVVETAASRRSVLVGMVLAVLILLTYAFSGDAAQVLQPRLSAIVFHALSLAAQSIWFGSFAYIGYVLLPLFTSSKLDYLTEMLVALLRRLTPFILIGIGLSLLSALFLGNASISNPAQFFSDPYGRTLLVQIGIVVVLLLLSYYMLFMLIPRLIRQTRLLPVVDSELPARRTRQLALGVTQRRLSFTANTVALLGAAFLLCSALLAFFAPPIVFPATTYSNQPAQTNTASSAQTRQIGDLSVTLLILPQKIGNAHTVIVAMNDSSGRAISDAQVHLEINMQAMDMGTANATIQSGKTTYTATFDQQQTFDMAGLWNVAITIQRPGQAAMQGSFQVMLSA